ncbi:MAG: hypothetical protein MUD14_26925 [Hydrococcus sp. Prado102]|jgi:hypothetical protein|nr:hypothetical protein [Hydrococcus sp. Prado102]
MENVKKIDDELTVAGQITIEQLQQATIEVVSPYRSPSKIDELFQSAIATMNFASDRKKLRIDINSIEYDYSG